MNIKLRSVASLYNLQIWNVIPVLVHVYLFFYGFLAGCKRKFTYFQQITSGSSRPSRAKFPQDVPPTDL